MQGVVFTGLDILAVYQVKESEKDHPLQGRDVSGGGGRYSLEILFLDRKEGRELKILHFTTEASGQSGVYPTHDGRFLVVTAKMLRLYSPDFSEITSRLGPIGQNGQTQAWNISVVPPGRRVLAHTSISSMPFLLDADTLQTIPNPTPKDVPLWTGWGSIFPERINGESGVLSADGQWLPLDYGPKHDSCTFVAFLSLPHQVSVGGRGCKSLRVFSLEGQLVWDLPVRDEINGFASNGSLLAAAFYHYHADPLDLGTPPTPLRIAIYDLDRKLARCSIPITEDVSGWWQTSYYDISPGGTVAVGQKNILSLY